MTLHFLLNSLYETIKDYVDPSQVLMLTLIGASSYYTVKLCHAMDFRKSDYYIPEDDFYPEEPQEMSSSQNDITTKDVEVISGQLQNQASESRITHYSEDDNDTDIVSQIENLEKQIEGLQKRLTRLRMLHEINGDSEDSDDDSDEELHVRYTEESSVENPLITFELNSNIFNNPFDLKNLSNTMKLMQVFNSKNTGLFNSEKALHILAKRFAVEVTSEMLDLWKAIFESEETKKIINNPLKLFQEAMFSNSGTFVLEKILTNTELREKFDALERLIRKQSNLSLKLDHQTITEIMNEYII